MAMNALEHIIFLAGEGANNAAFWTPVLEAGAFGMTTALVLDDLEVTEVTLEALAAALTQRLEKIGPAHLVGHGVGAVVCALAAGASPSLALSVTTIGAAANADPALHAVLAGLEAASDAGVAAAVALPLLYSRYSLNAGSNAVRGYRANPPGSGQFRLWLRLFDNLGDRRKAIRGVESPMLAVVGNDDTFTPLAYTHEIVEWARNALLVQVSHAGHMAPLENPREVAQLVKGFTERYRDLGGTTSEWFEGLEDDEGGDEATEDGLLHRLPFDN